MTKKMRRTTRRIEYNSSTNPLRTWNKNASQLSSHIKIKLKLKEGREEISKRVSNSSDSKIRLKSKKRFSLKFLKRQFMKRPETR